MKGKVQEGSLPIRIFNWLVSEDVLALIVPLTEVVKQNAVGQFGIASLDVER